MRILQSRLVNVYDLQPFYTGGGDEFLFRIEVFSDGNAFFAYLMRYEFYRLQPSFSQKGEVPDPLLLSDEMVLVRDGSIGQIIEDFQESSEAKLVDKIVTTLAQTFNV